MSEGETPYWYNFGGEAPDAPESEYGKGFDFDQSRQFQMFKARLQRLESGVVYSTAKQSCVTQTARLENLLKAGEAKTEAETRAKRSAVTMTETAFRALKDAMQAQRDALASVGEEALCFQLIRLKKEESDKLGELVQMKDTKARIAHEEESFAELCRRAEEALEQSRSESASQITLIVTEQSP